METITTIRENISSEQARLIIDRVCQRITIIASASFHLFKLLILQNKRHEVLEKLLGDHQISTIILYETVIGDRRQPRGV